MKTRPSTFFATVCFALFYPAFALAQAQPPAGQPPWDWPGHWHMWGGGWGFWWIFPLFIIAACVAIFFFFAYRMCGGHPHWGPWHAVDKASGDPTFSALQLLNERYAKGEIQKTEYEERKAAILTRGPR